MKKTTFLLAALLACCCTLRAVDLTGTSIVFDTKDAPLVEHMAGVLADDVERVTGVRPEIGGDGASKVVLATVKCSKRHKELKGEWERYAIDTEGNTVYVTGSDPRGLAYGVLHISEAIGVSPWYWFADVVGTGIPSKARNFSENFVSRSPSVRYRGFFINDEDWGLKVWASENYEKELGDIGPKTYDRVCELILRLKGNMLAPAMHSCTGAFYSHPESQAVADKWGIMITTSHCEPLLFNNAALSEWDKTRDGEWNYETNSSAMLAKLDARIKETRAYDNIYTTGLRGLHDEAMKGSTDPSDRARTLEKVFAKQRAILAKYKKRRASDIPQIFVPYKETLDIYDAGLKVPDDITLVWPDDNYGYMKRVSNGAEQARSGGSGVYYHLSYCGVPHDNLWISTTAPMLMYEELLKAYNAGADRYWLLNVGDIKPMEIETQMFFDMAWDFGSFSYANANARQARWLASVFGEDFEGDFQYILDNYYRLAWDRKPEFMGYEMEWDTPEYSRLYDSGFSFEDGSAQKRLVEYQNICFAYEALEAAVMPALRPALFEMLGYSVLSSYQMNRKYLYAQANHETGLRTYSKVSIDADSEIESLLDRYNGLLDGKWNGMMSEVPPGYTALYHLMPEYVDEPTDRFRLPDEQRHPSFLHKVDMASLEVAAPFRMLEGIGTDWRALQMGEPLDSSACGDIDIVIPSEKLSGDEVKVCIAVVPLWPVAKDRSNRFAVSFDGGGAVVCENLFQEWGREWKIQVLENSKEFILSFPVDRSLAEHRLTLSIVDPGQIVQKITFE